MSCGWELSRGALPVCWHCGGIILREVSFKRDRLEDAACAGMGAAVPKPSAGGHLLQWKAGICKDGSMEAKAGKRGRESKPVSIYFSLHSFLGSSHLQRPRKGYASV